jgi:hypothetical protein
MAEMTDYLEGALIDHVLRNTAMTSPTTVYVSLHTASPTETGAVGELAVANGYARVSVTFGADTDGVSTNSGAVTFTASGGNWGSITHFAIWDASSAGNSLLWSALDTSRTVNDGDSLEFASAAISVTFA